MVVIIVEFAFVSHCYTIICVRLVGRSMLRLMLPVSITLSGLRELLVFWIQLQHHLVTVLFKTLTLVSDAWVFMVVSLCFSPWFSSFIRNTLLVLKSTIIILCKVGVLFFRMNLQSDLWLCLLVQQNLKCIWNGFFFYLDTCKNLSCIQHPPGL